MSERWVLHLDLDAFFASVEELLRPELAGLPIIVGGRPDARGVVASASYAARRYGVRSAMPTAQALRLCPPAVLVPPRHGVYQEYSRQVMEILREYSPLVEQISIDEAFVDITGCDVRWGPPLELARAIQTRIKEEVGLSASIGIAGNKLVAKIASDVCKPFGIKVVPTGEEAAFLAPFDIERLWGIGPMTAAKLRGRGVRTIGELAGVPPAQMEEWFGKYGLELAAHARGIDPRAVHPERQEPKSVSHEQTFARDVADPELVRRELLRLSEKVGARLRRDGLQGRTVAIKLRYSDFSTITRQMTLDDATDIDEEIFACAWGLWQKAWRRGRPVRLLGVGVHNLVRCEEQLALFDLPGEDAERERRRELHAAIDAIRQKYGDGALRRASLLGRRALDPHFGADDLTEEEGEAPR